MVDVPLVFTVNTNFTEASYLMWPKTMDTPFEGPLSGNSSLENLPNGNYVVEVFATTDKGDHLMATAYFTINKGLILPLELNPPIIYIILAIVISIVVVASISLVYFRRRKKSQQISKT